jgi:hypothetical protein
MITFATGPDQLGGQNFKFSNSLREERQKSRSEVSFRMLFSKKSRSCSCRSSSQVRSPIEGGEASEVAQKTEKKRSSYLSRSPDDVV